MRKSEKSCCCGLFDPGWSWWRSYLPDAIPEESRNERGGGSKRGPYHQGVPIVTAWIIHVAYKLKKACQTLESHNMARISFRALDSHSHRWIAAIKCESSHA
ncbi:hypothetical protein I7I51_05711 [Histoplasma capsulatum]|uniref:Uncharacterized protein n=1 Tax=Ajellomyces capsulatus TaxID=5037 RepID=A0A8A1M330_AJECA|nr:hypothetical protein I7I51_05711 [Histoplasma capsulatum]